MGRSSAEVQREIAETRRNIEGQVVELRRQSRIQAGRVLSVALVGLGAVAVIGTGLIVYRMTRPVSWGERARRVAPRRQARRMLREAARNQKVVVENRENRWESLVLKAARAAGTAAVTAAVPRLMEAWNRQRATPAQNQETRRAATAR